MVTGQKDILKVFSSRRPKKIDDSNGANDYDKKDKTQQVLVDDSYYVYVLHRR